MMGGGRGVGWQGRGGGQGEQDMQLGDISFAVAKDCLLHGVDERLERSVVWWVKEILCGMMLGGGGGCN